MNSLRLAKLAFLNISLLFVATAAAAETTEIRCPINPAAYYVPPYVLVIHDLRNQGLNPTFAVQKQPSPAQEVVASGEATLVEVDASGTEMWNLFSLSGRFIGTLLTGQLDGEGGTSLTWNLNIPSSMIWCLSETVTAR